MRIVSGASTDTGQVREGNEDSYLVDRHLELFAVADGMGGHRAGEVASATALDGLRAAVAEGSPVADAVGRANTAVWDRAANDTELAGMGTTLTAAFFDGTTLTVAHVGNSRAYLFRNDALEQLTMDHSLVAELIRDGKISEDQAAVHPQRSIITRALGVDSTVDVDVYSLILNAGDRVVICSDGLTSMVRTPRIAEILGSESDPTAAANALVDAANAAGGEDNITVVVLDAVGEGRDPLPSSVAAAIRARPADDPDLATGPIEVVEPAAVAAATTSTSIDTASTESRETPAAEAAALPRDTAAYREPRPPRRVGRGIGRVALFVLPILVILGVAVGAIGWYARHSYYVAFRHGTVTVYQGRPGGLFGWDPTIVKRTTLQRTDLTQDAAESVGQRKEFSTKADALAFIERNTKTTPSTSSTTATTAPTSSTTVSSTTTTP
ncbi:MAG: Stp1/IreP family PP2C-type Ser/Thr phosphatase [Acidimicrobiia bacterium]